MSASEKGKASIIAAFGLAGLARVWAGRFVRTRVEGKTLPHSDLIPRALLKCLVFASALRADQAIQSQYRDRRGQGPCTTTPTVRLELTPSRPLSHLFRQPMSPTRKSFVPCQRQVS